jgi:hypothetical protein
LAKLTRNSAYIPVRPGSCAGTAHRPSLIRRAPKVNVTAS